VEAVVRETCEQILTEPGVPKEKLVLRAVALEIAAEAFLSIKKDGDPAIQAEREKASSAGDDYVKVDTPSSKSKEREAGYSVPVPPTPPPRPHTQGQPPHIPPRPHPAPAPGTGEEGKQETLHAAYKACKSSFSSVPYTSPVELWELTR